MNRTQKKKYHYIALREQAQARWSKRYPRNDVKVGDIIESCNLHLCLVKEIDNRSGNIWHVSLMTGLEGGCDLYHCGVFVVPTKEVIMKLEAYKNGGEPALRDLWHKKLGLT